MRFWTDCNRIWTLMDSTYSGNELERTQLWIRSNCSAENTRAASQCTTRRAPPIRHFQAHDLWPSRTQRGEDQKYWFLIVWSPEQKKDTAIRSIDALRLASDEARLLQAHSQKLSLHSSSVESILFRRSSSTSKLFYDWHIKKNLGYVSSMTYIVQTKHKKTMH